MPTGPELVDMFDKRHGGTGLRIGNSDTGRLYYADGSWRCGTHWSGPLVDCSDLTEPERLRNILKWHTEVLRRAKASFEKRRAEALNMAQSNAAHGIGPPTDMLNKVKELADAVRQAQANRDAAQEALDATVPPPDRQREKQLAKAAVAKDEFINDLNQIRI